MISKELAKAVLGSHKGAIYSDGEVLCVIMNEHELAYRCKEWADSKNAVIISWVRGVNNGDDCAFTEVYFADTYDEDDDSTWELTHGATEPQAIFAACEWILKANHVH